MLTWTSKRQPLLGIDISSSAVKLIELSYDGRRYRVESYAVMPLPTEAGPEQDTPSTVTTASAIKAAVKISGTRRRHAAAAVAGASVITKIIPMPAELDAYAIEEKLQVEAEQYIPYNLDEVRIDFDTLGPTDDKPGMQNVLLAACRKESIDDRVTALRLAGLKTKIIDVESYATLNALPLLTQQFHLPPDPNANVALVDIGSVSTKLAICRQGRIICARDQDFGGRHLREEIQRHYGLSYDEAGLAKKQATLPNFEKEILDPFRHAITQMISRSLQFFYSSSDFRGVDHIVLAGGGANIRGLDSLVENTIGAPTLVANPFIDMTIAPRISAQLLAHDASAMLTACGLALRSYQ